MQKTIKQRSAKPDGVAPAKKPSLLVRFRSADEYKRLQQAARKEQIHLKDMLRHYPSVSKFLRDAGEERANRVMGKKQ